MRNLRSLILFITVVCCMSCASSKPSTAQVAKVDQIIRTKMKNQEDAWNKGDLESFMIGYWQSEKLSFIGSRGMTKGWQTTLDSYKKGYPDKAAMGRLKFDILSIEAISSDAYYVIGKYTLFREADQPSGHYTLLWKRIDGEWVIVSDHSS